MFLRASVTFFLLLSTALWSAPAYAASKLIALVVTNTTESAKGEMKSRLDALRRGLFRYTSEPLSIINSENLPRAELNERVNEFRTRLQGKDAAIVIYIGPTAHDSKDTYFVPADWSAGQSRDEFVPLNALLDDLRRATKGKSLVFIDSTMKPHTDLQNGFMTGLGALDHGANDEVLIAHAAPAGSVTANTVPKLFEKLAVLLEDGKPDKPLKLTRLAALVQQDVMFDSGGLVVPRITGSVATADLTMMDDRDMAKKSAQCIADNKTFKSATAFVGVQDGVTQTSNGFLSEKAGKSVSTRPFFNCPFFSPPEEQSGGGGGGGAAKTSSRQRDMPDKPERIAGRKDREERHPEPVQSPPSVPSRGIIPTVPGG